MLHRFKLEDRELLFIIEDCLHQIKVIDEVSCNNIEVLIFARWS